MSAPPVNGIIVTHGSLGQELVNSSRKITGVRDGVRVLSNLGFSNQELAREIVAELKGQGEGRCVIFTDMPAGSCYIAAMYAVHEVPGHVIVAGVNLPILLDFLTKRRTLAFEELVGQLMATGKRSLKKAP
ncbi:PTS sugar transporter subunit IIA [candidate division KSB1 bacterium]